MIDLQIQPSFLVHVLHDLFKQAFVVDCLLSSEISMINKLQVTSSQGDQASSNTDIFPGYLTNCQYATKTQWRTLPDIIKNNTNISKSTCSYYHVEGD